MNNKAFEKQLMDYLSGAMNKDQEIDFENFIIDHPNQQQYFEDMKRLWRGINKIPIPELSTEADEKFYKMLMQEKQQLEQKNEPFFDKVFKSLFSLLYTPSKYNIAYGFIILCLGLGIGYFFRPRQFDVIPPQLTEISNAETNTVRETLVLTLLEQSSVNKRLKGVSEVSKLITVEHKVIEALLTTLNNDPNINVRLASIEALTKFSDNPEVREGLVESIIHQDSPIIQSTLADLMVALQEKKSVKHFKELIKTKDLDETVKQIIEESISSII